uniref:Uncharacterized protein n=1 Tax=Anguilla anguilla TaxID=7936 RepID=A0A0E9Q311_ANGAN
MVCTGITEKDSNMHASYVPTFRTLIRNKCIS